MTLVCWYILRSINYLPCGGYLSLKRDEGHSSFGGISRVFAKLIFMACGPPVFPRYDMVFCPKVIGKKS